VGRGEGERKTLALFFPPELRVICGSGTYMRSIADSLGREVGIPALALSIKRTKVGKWSLQDTL
jgi:tRNA pseudouridine55 synthase